MCKRQRDDFLDIESKSKKCLKKPPTMVGQSL